jgi:hypothetical protein
VISFCIGADGHVDRNIVFPNQRTTSKPTTCTSTGTSRIDGATLYVSFRVGACDNGRTLLEEDMSCVRHATSLVCLNAADNSTETYTLRIY